MNIYELADLLEINLKITRYNNQNNRFTTSFENCETKESKHSCILAGTYGNANSIIGSIEDYIVQIRGKLLVIKPGSGINRREFMVPTTLTHL